MTQRKWFFRAVSRLAGGFALASVGIPINAQQPAYGQQPTQPNVIGTVSLEDATVTGATATSNDRATLVWNGTVVAKDHVAYVELARGGNVRVCATSGLHLTVGTPAAADVKLPDAALAPGPGGQVNPVLAAAALASAPVPLMLSLDRGALEVRMSAISSDLLMTPDLRIGFSEAGALDLRVRVTRNGDTCVENRVAGLSEHPTLQVASMFGDETYHVLPGQHVLFERGSLREVVDNESSPCGCPTAPTPPPMVEAGDLSLRPGAKVSKAQAETQHPFPAAVSQGLAPPPAIPQAPPGAVHAQLSATLSYSGSDADGAAKKDVPQTPAAVPLHRATPLPPARKGGFFHAVGQFFKKVF
jgi:hypothetical protein